MWLNGRGNAFPVARSSSGEVNSSLTAVGDEARTFGFDASLGADELNFVAGEMDLTNLCEDDGLILHCEALDFGRRSHGARSGLGAGDQTTFTVLAERTRTRTC